MFSVLGHFCAAITECHKLANYNEYLVWLKVLEAKKPNLMVSLVRLLSSSKLTACTLHPLERQSLDPHLAEGQENESTSANTFL